MKMPIHLHGMFIREARKVDLEWERAKRRKPQHVDVQEMLFRARMERLADARVRQKRIVIRNPRRCREW